MALGGGKEGECGTTRIVIVPKGESLYHKCLFRIASFLGKE